MSGKGIRSRALPAGWYPSDGLDIKRVFDDWELSGKTEQEIRGRVAITPHAGWSFSGRLSYRTIRLLDPECSVMIVIGGHMPPGSGIVGAFEKWIDTPLGEIEVNENFMALLNQQVKIRSDNVPDNTVEVQMPIIKHLFPGVSVVWLRVGAGDESIELGRSIVGAALEYGKKVCVIGSTDLTHYGPNFGFTPKGTGPEAIAWAKRENDAGIIRHMVEMNTRSVLEWGNKYRAACSSGAAAAAMQCADGWGCEEGILIGYENSCNIQAGSSFVGYAGIVYSNRES